MATYNPVPARRGSIVGPLILLTLGVLFLLHNLRPEFSFARLAQYWPYLLILWGAARLVEYFVCRATSRPIASTLSGGEIFLVVLICLAGTGSAAFRGRNWQFGIVPPRGMDIFGESFHYDIHAEHAVTLQTAVLIQNLEGDVKVTGAEGNQMTITARKTVRALSRSDADAADRETSLEISEQGGRLVVRTNQDRARDNQRVWADLEIRLPKSASLALEGRSGDLDVSGVCGPLKITYRRADQVRASGVQGNVEIEGRGRDVEIRDVAGAVSINGTYTGNVRVQNVARGLRFTSTLTTLSVEKLPGRMDMEPNTLALNGVAGPIRLESRRKDVRIGAFSGDVDIQLRQQGELDLRPEKGNSLGSIRAETARGDIRLSLPAGARFVLEGSAPHGNVINDLGVGLTVDRRGTAAQVHGGAGGPAIHLTTGRGDIVLGRAD